VFYIKLSVQENGECCHQSGPFILNKYCQIYTRDQQTEMVPQLYLRQRGADRMRKDLQVWGSSGAQSKVFSFATEPLNELRSFIGYSKCIAKSIWITFMHSFIVSFFFWNSFVYSLFIDYIHSRTNWWFNTLKCGAHRMHSLVRLTHWLIAYICIYVCVYMTCMLLISYRCIQKIFVLGLICGRWLPRFTDRGN